MAKTVRVRRRPGKVQAGFVFLVCVLLMAASVYVGLMLLTGEPPGMDFHWAEELRSYFR
jgi:hypothetical protein